MLLARFIAVIYSVTTKQVGVTVFPPRWLQFLPCYVRVRIESRPNLLRIIANTGWLVFDKVIRMGVGMLVGVWVARYLGPESFGLMSYAGAFVGLFTAIATLGLNGVVVRNLVQDPNSRNETLGTAFFLQIGGGLLAFFLAVVVIGYLRPADALTKIVVTVLGLTMFFKASDVVRYWFESKVQSRTIVWIENGVFLLFAIIKVVLILNEATLMAFVLTILAESGVVAIGLLWAYSIEGRRFFEWRWRLERAKSLLSDSWPLILSGLAVTMYMRIDQIMLGGMLGNDEVGVYAAAARISEIWYFVPTAIVSSIFPRIVNLKKNNQAEYISALQKLYDFLIISSIVVAIILTCFSNKIVLLLYGNSYSEAASILSIQIWAGVFVTMGIARGPWVLAEGLQRYTYKYIGIALVVNLIGNYFLIPLFGVTGAAVSSALAQATTAIFAPSLFYETRPAVKMFLKSLNPVRWGYIILMRKNIK